MKMKYLSIFLLFIFIIKISCLQEAFVEEIERSSKYFQIEYQDMNSIPTNYFSYESNSNEDLRNLFDRNLDTVFKSKYDYNSTFSFYIDFTFKDVIKIDKILYGNEGYFQRGFPVVLTLTFSNGTNEENQVEELVISSQGTSNFVIFHLDKIYYFKNLRFHFTKIHTGHKWIATGKEIIFYQPENELGSIMPNLFLEYYQLTLKPEYNNIDFITQLIENAKNIYKPNFEVLYEKYLKRAEDSINGKLQKFDKRRHFSTNPNNENSTIIQRNGNIKSRGNVLKFYFGVSNKQITGISCLSNITVTVFVHSENKNDPLPDLGITQYYGYWGEWQKALKLSYGINKIVIPTFNKDRLTSFNPKLGGPLYLVNYYTKNEQSEGIYIYIEGGETFPVFRKGESEEDYYNFLQNYIRNINHSTQFNLTELQSDFVILNFRATTAANAYLNDLVEKRKSVQQNLINWDIWMKKLYEFDGIQFNESQKYYNEMNNFLKVVIRLAQPYGAAYAHYEHIGIFYDDWENSMAYFENLGWGFAHEFGHVIDLPARAIPEITNNMISKYEEVVIRKVAKRGSFESTTNCMANNEKDTSCWNQISLNFLIFWHIETYCPGYWGKLENLYRFEDTAKLNQLEKFVYYTSLVIKTNATLYFEKFGFYFSGNPFKYSSTSDEFKNLMGDTEKIKNETNFPKIWYYDDKQYTIITDEKIDKEELNLYENSENFGIEIKAIVPIIYKENENIFYDFYLIFNNQDVNKIGFLGYEVYEGDFENGNYKIKSFTYNDFYYDKSHYNISSYKPKYAIRAYDRKLQYTGKLIPKESCEFQKSCRVLSSNKDFISISECIENSNQEDKIILLLEDIYENNIIIKNNKILTFVCEEHLEKCEFFRFDEKSPIIKTEKEGNLIIEDNKIIFNGRNISASNPLIDIGTGNSKNVILKNIKLINSNSNTQVGGMAINCNCNLFLDNIKVVNNVGKYVGGIIINSGIRANINNSYFENNKATDTKWSFGGALQNKRTLYLENNIFINNSVSGGGGALANYDGGVSYLTNNSFIHNSVINGNGGAVYINGRTDIMNCNFVDNKAKLGGAVSVESQITARKVTIIGSEFKNNLDENGNDINIINRALVSMSDNIFDSNNDS